MKAKKFFIILILAIFMTGCSGKHDYGVFLSLDDSDMGFFTNYDTVVIDAQYFTKEDIQYLHDNGVEVFSYINIGSLENFRDYYEEYEKYTIGAYENWEEERWVDVSSVQWQEFICDTVAKELYNKGIDGFFVDNCDVYYNYKTDTIYEGLVDIHEKLGGFDKDVVINGGDEFVSRYIEENGNVQDILTGVNQEEVFSTYDFDNGRSSESSDSDRKYYQDYLEKCSELGAEIYIIEYTQDKQIIDDVEKYCNENGFKYYISDSIELD